MILGATMIATAEAFVFAEKLGLSHQALFDVASTSSGQSWSLTNYCPVPGPVPASPANNGYKPGFAAALMLKDLKLAQEAALAFDAMTPIGAEAAQLYALFNARGMPATIFPASSISCAASNRPPPQEPKQHVQAKSLVFPYLAAPKPLEIVEGCAGRLLAAPAVAVPPQPCQRLSDRGRRRLCFV